MLRAAEIGTTDEALLEFFKKRTLGDADRGKLDQLIRQLGDDSFEVREKSSASLIRVGSAAEPALREATKSPDVEVARRAQECLRQLENGAGAAVPMAAIRILVRHRAAGAIGILLGYLPFAETEPVALEIEDALIGLGRRDGKLDAELLAALKDKDAQRRGAAAEAVATLDSAGHQAALHALLADPSPAVQFRVAAALVRAKDKQGIPALIEAIAKLPAEQAWQPEELLLRLAAEQAPKLPTGDDESTRRQRRQAWAAWWQANQGRVDLARLHETQQELGYSLLVLSDVGEALEINRHKKPLWRMEGLRFPLDAQYLPGERFLFAEHGENRVTERNRKGEVLWQRTISEPLVAQRLANGHTFIATATELIEVDHAGKEVWSHRPVVAERIMKACKLTNGEVGVVVVGRFVRMDTNGKELASFAVGAETAGGRLEMLRNGHILIPERSHNRVVELDDKGKTVWQAQIDEPIAAVRLDNGHTLVTTYASARAVELDRAGHMVWQYKDPQERRINRAFRR